MATALVPFGYQPSAERRNNYAHSAHSSGAKVMLLLLLRMSVEVAAPCYAEAYHREELLSQVGTLEST